jgi:hypothetical protein
MSESPPQRAANAVVTKHEQQYVVFIKAAELSSNRFSDGNSNVNALILRRCFVDQRAHHETPMG